MTTYRLTRTEYRYALLWLAAKWSTCGQPSAAVDSPTIQPEEQ